jgi:2-iminobutanoate/2-iminopropanoate deaminase
MKPKTIRPDGVVRPRAPYSPCRRQRRPCFTAVEVGFDLNGEIVEGGVGAQTRGALENLRTCHETAGSDLEHVVKVTAFLVDLGEFEDYTRSTASSSRSRTWLARRSERAWTVRSASRSRQSPACLGDRRSGSSGGARLQ